MDKRLIFFYIFLFLLVIGIIFFIYWLLGTQQILIWKDVVPYEISNDFTFDEQNVIFSAMNKITEASGGLKFIKKTNHVEFISFEKTNSEGNICGESLISKQFGGQKISLHSKCINEKTIIHELMHALGFDHEHSRPDRDNYITINYSNILDSCKNQFDKKGNRIWKEIVSKTPYDYISIMHYDAFSCSKSTKAIFSAKDIYQFGSKNLSEIDKQRLKMYYSTFSKK